MEEINLKDLWSYYKRYLKYVILAVILFAGAMYSYSKWLKVPMYSTSTKIILVRENENEVTSTPTTEQSDFEFNKKLVSTYRNILNSRLIVSQVIDDLDLEYEVSTLSSRINIEAIEDTPILKVTVSDEDPEIATMIVDKLISVFDKEIKKIYKINNLTVIEPAEVPEFPSNINTIKDTVIAGLVGFVLSSAIVFVVFYFDDILRSSDELDDLLSMPTLAKVFKDSNKTDLIVENYPNALASESIRNLRTNLQFSSIDNELKSILVTSTISGDGKSFISANLAISFAQSGKKVLLIDCDLRRGRQHKIFGASGKKGLSNLLVGDVGAYNDYILKTSIKNLYFMPRGTTPPNPSELLGSKKNEILLEILKKRCDIIILDGTPITGLSDSLILSSLVDETILVTSINHTPKTELLAAKKALDNVGAKVAGCVANNVVSKNGKNGEYYYYYGSDEKKKTKSKNEEKL